MSREFQLVAVTPPVSLDPSIAIAASRAGCIGVLDLQYSLDEQCASKAVRRLVDFGGDDCGIKLSGSEEAFASSILSSLPQNIRLIILTAGRSGFLKNEIRRIRRGDLRVLVEATCLEEGRMAQQAGADGVIAKGHEAGGYVGEETTFVLLQRLLAELHCPVWAHGGIGIHTTSACYVAGAAGAVLDAQLWLTRECTLPGSVKDCISRMDGSETVCIGNEAGDTVRVHTRPGHPGLEELRALVRSLAENSHTRAEIQREWRETVRRRAGWGSTGDIWLLGQDAAFARALTDRFKTTPGILQGIRESIENHVQAARQFRPLAPGSPLAQSHGTRYPIVQGPMTRVSDIPAFAERVATAGALPFLALALMRPGEITSLLDQTDGLLGEQAWGVGILGFVPPEIREQQMTVIRARRPRYALIAGGRPDQAQALEKDGIPTYLHVPSPTLLKMFLESGAQRFVFEGRECGGHVGPRSSFVLWEQMIEVLLQAIGSNDEADRYHILFAGGVHDSRSSAMVSVLAAPLAARGCRIGVLVGTAYLFTEEAVEAGAVVRRFQEEAVRCEGTVLLESGTGHDTRCVRTPYTEFFEQEKRRLLANKVSADEIRDTLERSNLGRLRIASKGIAHNATPGEDVALPEITRVSEEQQREQGIYMIGQVAALRDKVCRMEELHRDISVKSSEWFESGERESVHAAGSKNAGPQKPGSCDLAIIGMACLFPKAGNLQRYWENILNKVDAIREVPEDRWNWRQYFNTNPDTPDRVYSKWGGFLDDVPFDPLRYGLPPSSLSSIEPLQLLTLEVVRSALEDAGYLDRPFARERTSVILGVGGGLADLGHQYAVRSALPMYLKEVGPNTLDGLPEWTEESFPGILQNVAAGRVANRFDLGGVNFTVDAACASSLAAVHMAAHELESGNSEMVIVGGADTVQSPLAYLCFSKTRALSPRGKCRTFDETADGIVLSEGLAVVILKRLANAERDGDRIYAVIKGVAGSSDGRGKSLTAPLPEGQIKALQRAYQKSGISPQAVSLIEAHGTGTVAGDQAEVEALKRVLEEAGAARRSCAVGSVKSMIGHSKCAAGLAGLIKVAMALRHRVLPPTGGVETPNRKADFEHSPLYINSESRPWFRGTSEEPRRAGVSSFGFGGTNFHVVLEEYTRDFMEEGNSVPREEWPTELFLFSANSQPQLMGKIQKVRNALDEGARPACRDLANTLCELYGRDGASKLTLAIVASSLDDLREKLAQAVQELTKSETQRIENPRGIYFSRRPLAFDGKVAFLFPGQGSQYPDMLRELALQFSEVRNGFEFADRTLKSSIPGGLSSFIFPPPRFGEEEEKAARRALMQTDLAQPALGAAESGLCNLLRSMGVRPHMAAGHSYGEYVALWSANVLDDNCLLRLSECRGRFIREEAGRSPGTMAAVEAGREAVRAALEGLDNIWIANFNSPAQTVISGTSAGVDNAVNLLATRGIRASHIPVACAFHSPIVGAARDRLAEQLRSIQFKAPQFEVFSNASASSYPRDPKAIAELLADHLVKPVYFSAEVEAMYEAGARIFVEVGPSSVLTGLVGQILAEKPHRAIETDVRGRSALVQLQHALARLAAEGVPLDLTRLFSGRRVRELRLESLVSETREQPLAKTTWLVNGGRARPLSDAGLPRENEPRPAVEGRVASNQREDEITLTTVRSSLPTNGAHSAAVSILHSERPPEMPAIAKNGNAMQGNRTDVMLQYQRLMNRFLETQQSVMLAYLKSANGTAHPETVAQHVEVTPPLVRVAAANGAVPPPVSAVPAPEKVAQVSASTLALSNGHVDTPPATPGETGHDEENITRRLIEIVSDRTGYPPEMLDLDLNLEADLGINSIKKVEILGAFQRQCTESDANLLKGAMDRLTRLKTLRAVLGGLVSAMEARNSEPAGVPGAIPPPAQSQRSEGSDTPVKTLDHNNPRYRRTLTESRVTYAGAVTPPDGTILITDDGRGVATSLARRLRKAGGRVTVLGWQAGAQAARESLVGDITNEDSIAELIRTARAKAGPIAGLIHLVPLRITGDSGSMDAAVWRDRLNLDVRSLFLLARHLAAELTRAPGAWLIAASALGGDFGAGASRTAVFPGHGAIAGLVKSLAKEWPDVRCRVVDCDGSEKAEIIADSLMEELSLDDSEIEVGRRTQSRLCFQTTPAPLRGDAMPQVELTSDSIILVTGGARGITSAISVELARRYRPTLYLLGRSEFPSAKESLKTSEITGIHDLKKALIEERRARGEAPNAAHIEATCARLLKDREMRAALRAMEESGARVHYHPVDVSDATAVSALLERIYQTHGRIDGVIHGAGVIEDSLLGDKDPASYDRVFETKLFGALALVRGLRPDSLKFLVFFSSVAGLFGNRGQTDYAAANEALNQLSIALDRAWPARVVSINWGPWAEIGMVSAEIQRTFVARGVQPITPSAGQKMFALELERGSKGEVEIILGSGPWAGAPRSVEWAPDFVAEKGHEFPLLADLKMLSARSGSVDLTYVLNPDKHSYLADHLLDSRPVMPAAVVLELMAELVQRTWPNLEVAGARDFRVLHGIVLENGSMPIRITARPDRADPARRITVNIQDPTEGSKFYQATIVLSDRLEKQDYSAPSIKGRGAYPLTISESYERLLFHGPVFQGIEEIQGFSRDSITAILLPSSPGRLLKGSAAKRWLIDPVVVDSAFQLALLWARLNSDMTVLPVRFANFRRFRPLTGSRVRCDFLAQPNNGDHTFEARITFVDESGELLWLVEGVEFGGTNALNRLGGRAMRGHAG